MPSNVDISQGVAACRTEPAAAFLGGYSSVMSSSKLPICATPPAT